MRDLQLLEDFLACKMLCPRLFPAKIIMHKNQLFAALAIASTIPTIWGVSFDQNVNEPGPGVFYGSGNVNGSWTVDVENGIELGLRTKQRYPSANVFNSNGDGTYSWTDTTGLGPIGSNRASWNYDFSLNVASTGSALSDFAFKLYIDSDPSAGHTWKVIDPSAIGDNDTFGNAYAQNSENPRFSAEGLPGYDNTIAGTYDFALFALDSSGTVLAETYMRVNVNGGTAAGTFNGNVPDAGSSALLLGSAASALAFLRRQRLKQIP
jgi:hypothetical protein